MKAFYYYFSYCRLGVVEGEDITFLDLFVFVIFSI